MCYWYNSTKCRFPSPGVCVPIPYENSLWGRLWGAVPCSATGLPSAQQAPSEHLEHTLPREECLFMDTEQNRSRGWRSAQALNDCSDSSLADHDTFLCPFLLVLSLKCFTVLFWVTQVSLRFFYGFLERQ